MSNTETNRIENKEQLNEDFEQEVIAFLNHKEGGIIYVGIRKNGQVVGLKDVDLIENIGSGVLRILDAYYKSCFKFMEHFLRVTFKYRENPFEYDQEINQESDQKELSIIQNKILSLIKQNAKITQNEMGKILGVPREKIKYNIAILKDMNIIEREGSNKIGKWKILK